MGYCRGWNENRPVYRIKRYVSYVTEKEKIA